MSCEEAKSIVANNSIMGFKKIKATARARECNSSGAKSSSFNKVIIPGFTAGPSQSERNARRAKSNAIRNERNAELQRKAEQEGNIRTADAFRKTREATAAWRREAYAAGDAVERPWAVPSNSAQSISGGAAMTCEEARTLNLESNSVSSMKKAMAKAKMRECNSSGQIKKNAVVAPTKAWYNNRTRLANTGYGHCNTGITNNGKRCKNNAEEAERVSHYEEFINQK
jgi:hypothetical protein